MIVCKFGGTSVADARALERLVSIVRDRLAEAPLVVVSAIAGASDALIDLLDTAAAGKNDDSARALRALADRHASLLAAASAGAAAEAAARAAQDELFAMLEDLRRGVALVGDVTPWARARFVGAGELLSSRIVAAAFSAAGVEVDWIDARTVVRTQGLDPQKDAPEPSVVRELAAALVAPRLGPGRAVVTQGFIGGAVVDGVARPTLLGRGGSDYSASLLGSALDAKRVEIWTDVDGVLTSNPKIVPGARRVKSLSFEEASELAYFGANVLHPSTLLPAVEASIPVWVGNARNAAGAGTTILAESIVRHDGRFAVKAIAEKRGITVVQVVSTRMLMAHGFLARIFEVFDASRTAVDLVATSEVSVSLTIDDDRRLSEIVTAISAFAKVTVERGMAVICLVGEGLRGNSHVAAEVFRALRDVPVRMMTQGSSAMNLSLVVKEADVAETVRSLHEAFFRGPLPAEIFAPPPSRATEDVFAPTPVPQATLVALAARHGTPLYVYDLATIDARVAALRRHLPLDPGRLLFACKANAHPELLSHLAARDVGIEAASPGEALRALDCGHAPERILVSATNAHAGDLVDLSGRGCRLALGSLSDVRRVGELAQGTPVLLRMNPGVGDGHHRHVVTGGAESKFGIPLAELEEALDACRRAGLPILGLHAHMGSGILDPAPLLSSARALLSAARRAGGFDVIDFGGGFGIPYRDGEAELDLAAYGAALAAELASLTQATGRRPVAWFEPGRFIAGPAGCLLARVTCRKESHGHVFVGLDTGMNHFLRPALYGAFHRILNLSAPDAPIEWVEIVGNVCESTDVFASARALPRAEEGHVLAILDAGAYGFTMASAYNLWPLPKEVVLPRVTIDVDISGLALRFEGLSPALAEELRREWPAYVRTGSVPPSLTIRIEDDERSMVPGRFMEGTLRIETTPAAVVFQRDEGELVQDVEGARAVVRLAQGDPGRRFWGLVNLACGAVGWRLQQLGGGVVHAAGIVMNERAFLLVGPSGSGKTTWARAAARAGLPVLSDDCVLVAASSGRMSALGSPFRAKDFPSPGPGRWPVAALLMPRWDAKPSLAPANRLMLEARIAANLLYSAPAWEEHTGAEGSAAAIAAGAPAFILSFDLDARWIPLLATIP